MHRGSCRPLFFFFSLLTFVCMPALHPLPPTPPSEQVDKMKRTLGQVDSSASAVREENDEYVAKLKVLRDGLFGALQGLAIPGASIKPESGEAIDGFVIAVRDAMQSASADPGFRAEVETRLKGIGVAPPQPAATAVP